MSEMHAESMMIQRLHHERIAHLQYSPSMAVCNMLYARLDMSHSMIVAAAEIIHPELKIQLHLL